jgi:hypothetical protein
MAAKVAQLYDAPVKKSLWHDSVPVYYRTEADQEG